MLLLAAAKYAAPGTYSAAVAIARARAPTCDDAQSGLQARSWGGGGRKETSMDQFEGGCGARVESLHRGSHQREENTDRKKEAPHAVEGRPSQESSGGGLWPLGQNFESVFRNCRVR